MGYRVIYRYRVTYRHPQWKITLMEDNLKGRSSQGRVSKTTSMEDTLMEDDRNGRKHQWKTTSIEDNLKVRQPQGKTTSMEDDLNGRQHQWKVI